jgi:hypothetical protein
MADNRHSKLEMIMHECKDTAKDPMTLKKLPTDVTDDEKGMFSHLIANLSTLSEFNPNSVVNPMKTGDIEVSFHHSMANQRTSLMTFPTLQSTLKPKLSPKPC